MNFVLPYIATLYLPPIIVIIGEFKNVLKEGIEVFIQLKLKLFRHLSLLYSKGKELVNFTVFHRLLPSFTVFHRL